MADPERAPLRLALAASRKTPTDHRLAEILDEIQHRSPASMKAIRIVAIDVLERLRKQRRRVG